MGMANLSFLSYAVPIERRCFYGNRKTIPSLRCGSKQQPIGRGHSPNLDPERRLLLALIDEKDMERVYVQEENFRQGLKLGLSLGWEVFRCEDEPHCF